MLINLSKINYFIQQLRGIQDIVLLKLINKVFKILYEDCLN